MKFFDKNGREIKVGDLVRCIGKNYPVVELGDKCYLEFNGQKYGYTVSEMVGYKVVDDDLNELVRKANEGFQSLRTLHVKYYGQFDFGGEDKRYERYNTNSIPCGIISVDPPWKVRVKSKTFTPFIVGNNWKVELSEDGKTLTIGCQKFGHPGYKFSEEFERHCNADGGPNSFSFCATKMGFFISH